MPEPTNYHALPPVNRDSVGNRHVGGEQDIYNAAELIRPRNTNIEAKVATMARVASRIIDRITGKAMSLNDITPDFIGAATPASAAAKSITEARRRRPALPQVLGRIQELSAADRTLNIYHTGDSLAGSMSTELRQHLESTIGIVGVAFFPYVLMDTLSGTVSNAGQDTSDVSKTKFWETGRFSILSAGASVAIGQNIAASVSDIVANKFTLYLGREVGNGTATISVSYDGGSTWEADIETVDTSHTETGVLVKTYTLAAARLMRVRVVAASGPVQIIGAKLWDSTKCGAVVAVSGRDGALLSQYAAASSQAIRNTVMADYAPHLVTGQFSESVEEIASLPAWLDIWMEACPNADFLFTNIYDILNRDKTTYTDVVNAAYDSALATYPRFFLHDLAATFKSKEYLNEAGFHPLDAADVHLTGRDDMAWKAAASDLAGFMGLGVDPQGFVPHISAANSVETDFTAKGFKSGLPVINLIEVHAATSTISKIWRWFTALGAGSWRIRRRASSDAMAPFALDLRYDSDTGSITTYALIGTDGTVKLGAINTGSTTTAGADGYRAVIGTIGNSQKAARFQISNLNTSTCVDFGRGTVTHACVDRRFQYQSDTGFAHGSHGAGPKWLSGAVAPSVTCTMTLATPGVITVTGHGFANGMIVVFSTDGALPTGIVAGTQYFVKNATANTFEVSTTPTGTSRPTSGSQSGTHTVTAAATDGSIYSRSGAGGQMYVMESGVWVGK